MSRPGIPLRPPRPASRFMRSSFPLAWGCLWAVSVGLYASNQLPSPGLLPALQPPPAPAEPAAKIVLAEGQVLNHIGGGEAGAIVTLTRRNPDGSFGTVLATATSDELGDFRLMGVEALKGPAVVRIEKKGYAVILRDVILGEGEYPPFVDAELEGMFVLQGKVTDARNGQPVIGAGLTLRSPFREWEQTTGETGAFHFEKLFPGDMALIVEATGYGRESIHTQIGPDGNKLNVALKPERTVRIRTVDADGRPVAQVVLECYDTDRDDFRTTMTDQDGVAVLRGVHFDAGGFRIRAIHPDYIRDVGMERLIEFPRDAVHSEHELRLSPGARITGRVTDAATRKPLSDARVIVGTSVNNAAPQAFTDTDGRFTIRGVPPGKTVLVAYRAGFAPQMAELEASLAMVHEVNLAMGQPRVIRGVVLNHADQPSPRTVVRTLAWRGQDALALRAMTDDQGRFTLQDAPLDPFDLEASSPDGAAGRVNVGAETKDVVITLSMPREPMPARRGPKLTVGSPAPDVTLRTLEGKELKISALKGKTILIDFWATWCGPCIAEVPSVRKVHQTFGRREDFVMIGVSLDRDEQALRKFIEDRRMAWHHVFGEDAGVKTATDAYGVEGIPSMFLIAPDGKIAAVNLRGPAIADTVGRLLNRPQP